MPEAIAQIEAVATPNAASPASADQAWWSGYDDETKGYVQNKGLAAKPINEAFVQVSKFHREAERMIGAPANELVRLPKETNSPDWANVYKRLGALNAVEDYKFDGLKHAGDKELEPALVETLRKAAFGAHLSPDAAHTMAKEVVTHLDRIDASRLADETAKLQQEKTLLKANWGANEAANMVVARAAATALGVSPEAVATLEKAIGYSRVMEMFRTIGTKIGEDRFIISQGNGGNQPMTKEAAIAEKMALKNDNAWVTRYLNGGIEEKRKMEAIDRIISNVTA